MEDVAPVSTGDKCSICGFDLPTPQTGESKLQAPVWEDQEFKVILSYREFELTYVT